MILAAGRGERLRPVTDNTPKALVEVKGETLLERHLRALKSGGIRTVVINLGWLGDMIVERIGSGSKFGLNVIYSPEYDNILETGGGIHRALPLLGDEPFWIVNADIYTDFQAYDLELSAELLGHIILVPTPDHKPHSDFGLVYDKVCNSDKPTLTYSGIAVYRAELFAGQKPGRFPLAPLMRKAADHGKLAGSIYEGLWQDIGTPERLMDLNR
jgi:MurNAc alpha-1-phosphate uridylyltransferase